MPLKIQLKPKERVIINGAVIEGHDDARTEIVVLNNASVMRQKHILQQDEANTPVKRLYFALQMLYIEDRENHDPYKKSFEQYHKDLDETLSLPAIKVSLGLIKQAVDPGKIL
jgi:flagellar protein FlbT